MLGTIPRAFALTSRRTMVCLYFILPYLSDFNSCVQLSAVSTPNAPAALGPYVQAMKFKDTVYLSGCLGMDAKSAQLA